MTARRAAEWAAAPERPPAPRIDVLVPSLDRPAELAVTLSSLAAQSDPDFTVTVADQTAGEPVWAEPAVGAMVRLLRAQGRPVRLEHRRRRLGVAEQRHFLLSTATSAQVLFLDNDVWLEPGLLERMSRALDRAGCGFVGSAVQGLSFLGDRRPGEEEPYEPWEGPPAPETVRRGGPGFGRWTLHNAANLAHLAAARGLGPHDIELYKVAWVGGCVLFDRAKLLAAGGFGFWEELPPGHAGEDALAQQRVMARYGGCGLLPSGAVHLESPTTVTDRSVEATEVLDVEGP